MENFQPFIKELEERANASDNANLTKWMTCSAKLLKALDERNIDPVSLQEELNILRRQLDADTKPNMIRSFYGKMTDSVRKKFNLVTPGYYQAAWMSIGMAAFGVPFGMIFSMALDNFAFLGIGLPIGISIGIAIGAAKDKKAKADGLQLDIS